MPINPVNFSMECVIESVCEGTDLVFAPCILINSDEQFIGAAPKANSIEIYEYTKPDLVLLDTVSHSETIPFYLHIRKNQSNIDVYINRVKVKSIPFNIIGGQDVGITSYKWSRGINNFVSNIRVYHEYSFIDYSDLQLVQSEVDQVISETLDNATVDDIRDGFLNLSGNSAPSAQGLSDIQELKDNYGWEVIYEQNLILHRLNVVINYILTVNIIEIN